MLSISGRLGLYPSGRGNGDGFTQVCPDNEMEMSNLEDFISKVKNYTFHESIGNS